MMQLAALVMAMIMACAVFAVVSTDDRDTVSAGAVNPSSYVIIKDTNTLSAFETWATGTDSAGTTVVYGSVDGTAGSYAMSNFYLVSGTVTSIYVKVVDAVSVGSAVKLTAPMEGVTLVVFADGESDGFTFYSNGTLQVGSSTAVTVLLNGLHIAGGSASAVKLTAGSTLTISGCVITGPSSTSGSVSAVYVSGAATLAVTGSTISGSYVPNAAGGAIYAGNGATVTISDSTLTGNQAKNGGAVYCASNSTVTITKSTLSGNTANAGGAVCTANGIASLTITDSTMSSNRASSGNGGAINTADMTAKTALSVSNVLFDSNSASGNGGAVALGANMSAVFTGCTFRSNYTSASGGAIVASAGTLQFTDCAFNDNQAALSGGAAYIYNGSTVSVTSTTMSGNGATSGFGGAIYVRDGSTEKASVLTIANSTIQNSTSAAAGGAVYLGTYTTAQVTGGTISGNTSSKANGGAIYVSNNSSLSLTETTISKNVASNGGAIYVATTAAFTATDTAITGNTASANGGAIYFADGPNKTAKPSTDAKQIALTNCIIDSNQASTSGGALYVNKGIALTITGGSLSKNTATVNGGAIEFVYDSYSYLTLFDVAFDDNHAGVNGGAVNIPISTNFVMTGGSLTNNSAGGNGGALCFADRSRLSTSGEKTMTGITISGNHAGGYGGAISAGNYCKIIMESCTLNGNSSSVEGGAIAAWNSSTTIIALTGCQLSANSAPAGGAVYAVNGQVELTNTSFTGNTATLDGNGGAVYVGAGTINGSNVTLDGNYAKLGGQLYIGATVNVTTDDSTYWVISGSGSESDVYMLRSAKAGTSDLAILYPASSESGLTVVVVNGNQTYAFTVTNTAAVSTDLGSAVVTIERPTANGAMAFGITRSTSNVEFSVHADDKTSFIPAAGESVGVSGSTDVQITYTMVALTTNVYKDGILFSSDTVTMLKNSKATVTAQQIAGYHFVEAQVDGVAVTLDGSSAYTIADVTGNTISFYYETDVVYRSVALLGDSGITAFRYSADGISWQVTDSNSVTLKWDISQTLYLEAVLADSTYHFASWSNGVETAAQTLTVSDDVQLSAVSVKTYTITWLVEGVSTTAVVDAGTVPIYNGGTDPVKASTAQYYYEFSGWNAEIVAAAADATYEAQFTQYTQAYTVIFANYDGTVLATYQLDYGETPVYAGAIPTRATDAAHVYAFAGWDAQIAEVTGAATYTATYTADAHYYTVKLITGEGYTINALDAVTVPYGGSFRFTVALALAYTQSASDMAVVANLTVLSAAAGVYTISNITEDQTVVVTGVSLNVYGVVGTIDRGTVTYAQQEINYGGTSHAMEFTAADGYRIVAFTINGHTTVVTGNDVRSITYRSMDNVTESILVEVTTALIADDSGNGSVNSGMVGGYSVFDPSMVFGASTFVTITRRLFDSDEGVIRRPIQRQQAQAAPAQSQESSPEQDAQNDEQ